MAQGTSFGMAEEFGSLDFHSIRLEDRFIRTMETLIKQPDKSIWEAGENWADAKDICRMLGNAEFDREKIVKPRREEDIRRMSGYGGAILAVQDAAAVNYNTRLKTEGDGFISDKTLVRISIAVLRWLLTGWRWVSWTSHTITGRKPRAIREAMRVRKYGR